MARAGTADFRSFNVLAGVLTIWQSTNIMTEETTNLVLEHLRHIRSCVNALGDDMRHIILRLGAQDRHLAGLQVSKVGWSSEIDRIKERLQRIERRLELAD
jgi:hypothetical protein